jgi:hypothetical protein
MSKVKSEGISGFLRSAGQAINPIRNVVQGKRWIDASQRLAGNVGHLQNRFRGATAAKEIMTNFLKKHIDAAVLKHPDINPSLIASNAEKIFKTKWPKVYELAQNVSKYAQHAGRSTSDILDAGVKRASREYGKAAAKVAGGGVALSTLADQSKSIKKENNMNVLEQVKQKTKLLEISVTLNKIVEETVIEINRMGFPVEKKDVMVLEGFVRKIAQAVNPMRNIEKGQRVMKAAQRLSTSVAERPEKLARDFDKAMHSIKVTQVTGLFRWEGPADMIYNAQQLKGAAIRHFPELWKKIQNLPVDSKQVAKKIINAGALRAAKEYAKAAGKIGAGLGAAYAAGKSMASDAGKDVINKAKDLGSKAIQSSPVQKVIGMAKSNPNYAKIGGAAAGIGAAGLGARYLYNKFKNRAKEAYPEATQEQVEYAAKKLTQESIKRAYKKCINEQQKETYRRLYKQYC